MKRKPFTLIEILVVLSVIAVLVGMLMPALNKALKKAKKTKAMAGVRTLHLAVKQYETTYGFLPFTGANADTVISATQYSTLLNTLGALDAAANPKKLKFLELDKSNQYNDAWNNTLQVALDLDYDGDIDDAQVYGYTTLNTTIVVWSKGPDGLDSATDGDTTNQDNVKSWEK